MTKIVLSSLQCLSLIGTEGCLDLQLATNNARDLFAQKFQCFIQHIEQSGQQNEPGYTGEFGSEEPINDDYN